MKRLDKLFKQLSLEGLMDLKIDYAFKQLFGNKKNKDITMVFLNAFIKHWRRLQWKMRHFEEHLKIGKS
ncbi:hypothetical protein JOD43_004346 [Pullulanibacillus pueri]|nr:hypothetical protein [Pullulanibacillus pueri]